MLITKAILHILDFNSDVSVFSQKELDISNITLVEYLEKHLEHLQKDANQKPGEFMAGSTFLAQLDQYLKGEQTFIEFSDYMGNTLYEQISHSDKLEPIDLLVVDFTDEDIRYIALMLLTSKAAYTHQVLDTDGVVENQIIRHYAILPNTAQKVDSYALINCATKAIGFSEKKCSMEGAETYVLADKLLQCTSSVSSKEAVKIVSKIVTDVVEQHGENPALMVSKAKKFLRDNAEVASAFSPKEMGAELFSGSEQMEREFEKQVNDKQLPRHIKLEKNFAIRAGKNHKIKTDTGIEISFPVEYFENPNFIEFVNNPNGTISIEVKNIGKITNK